jgi:serine/threonine-protein kinase
LHKASQQGVHLTLGILRKSQAVSHALSFFWLDGFAVPAPAQVTQTVGRFVQCDYSKRMCFMYDRYDREKFKFLLEFPDLKPDDRLNSYKIIRLIGEGGVGKVYLARHIWLNHQVAVKVHNDFPTEKEISIAFFRAASFLSQMRHHNIVSFINFGIEGNRGFIVMEYVDGTPLNHLMDGFQTKNGVYRALQYFEQLLNAVRYAHNCSFLDLDNKVKRGIIHGDIKPQNVLISHSDDVKLTDFMVPDIQRFLAVRQHTLFSEAYAEYPTQAFGTPYYMAPEQAREGKVSELTDVFSLGVTLYHILTKKYPYQLAWEHSNVVEKEPPRNRV